ncbi:MAG: terpene cyclase/mutase family protein, partial [Verrucomicrobia bacterium]|nr:terpene cyclase/mutase family protein [Verrucomicrobiota bacterium]
MNRLFLALLFLAGFGFIGSIEAQELFGPSPADEIGFEPDSLASVFPRKQWDQIESSIDRALEWLASQQQADGSFPAIAAAQPAVTSLGVMAFLASGHVPEVGAYGGVIERAIDYVLSCQKEDGLLSAAEPEGRHVDKRPSHGATYNHAIAGLMLCEAFGMTASVRSRRIEAVVVNGLEFTRRIQTRPKNYSEDLGGWRYIRLRWTEQSTDSDLSVTGWHLMFMRAAKNAQFDVPEEYISDAMSFVDRCWDPRQGVFKYSLIGADNKTSRGVVGVGILCQSMAGRHQTAMAMTAGEWLLEHPFKIFGETFGTGDRFFYSAYYCSQAMAQLGGRFWRGFFPPLVRVLLSSQTQSGAWPEEPRRGDAVFGNAYTTALAVLALTP